MFLFSPSAQFEDACSASPISYLVIIDRSEFQDPFLFRKLLHHLNIKELIAEPSSAHSFSSRIYQLKASNFVENALWIIRRGQRCSRSRDIKFRRNLVLRFVQSRVPDGILDDRESSCASPMKLGFSEGRPRLLSPLLSARLRAGADGRCP